MDKTQETRTYEDGGVTVVETLKVPKNFDHHIILYAKSWYERSGNIIDDLRKLLCEYAMLDPKYVPDNNIQEALANCFAKYAPEYDRGRWIQEMLGWNWYNTVYKRTPEQVMVSALSIVGGEYVDPKEAMDKFVTKETLEKIEKMRKGLPWV